MRAFGQTGTVQKDGSQIIADDPEVVVGDVCELRAAGALSDSPNSGRSRFQPFVDFNVAAAVQFNAGKIEADPGGVGNAPRGSQDVAALNGPLA